MPEVPSEALTAAPLTGIILMAVGILTAFFGKTLFKAVVFLIGAVAGMIVGSVAGYFLGPHVGGGAGACGVLGGVVGFILGGFLALNIVKAILALSVGSLFAGLASAFTPDAVVALVAFLAGFIFAIIFMDKLLALITAVAGGVMAGLGTYMVSGSPGAGLLLGVVLMVLGLYYQFRTNRGDLSRPDRT